MFCGCIFSQKSDKTKQFWELYIHHINSVRVSDFVKMLYLRRQLRVSTLTKKRKKKKSFYHLPLCNYSQLNAASSNPGLNETTHYSSGWIHPFSLPTHGLDATQYFFFTQAGISYPLLTTRQGVTRCELVDRLFSRCWFIWLYTKHSIYMLFYVGLVFLYLIAYSLSTDLIPLSGRFTMSSDHTSWMCVCVCACVCMCVWSEAISPLISLQ